MLQEPVRPLKTSFTSPDGGSGRAERAGLADHELDQQIDAAVRARTTCDDEPRRSALGQHLLDLLDEQTRRAADR